MTAKLYNKQAKPEIKKHTRKSCRTGSSDDERIEERKGKKLDENYREFLCEFLIEGMSGILIAWIKKETKRDRDTASKNLIRVITGCLESAFDETP